MSKRTTLTLDDDVADGLASATRRAGRPFRDIVNEVIRRGLNRSVEAAPFRVTAVEMRRRAGIEIDDIEGLLDLLDGSPRR